METRRQRNPNSLANLKPAWRKGECGNPKGRPKDRVKLLLKEVLTNKVLKKNEPLKWFEIDTIEQAVLALRLADIQALAKADDTPAYMKTLAMAIVIDMKNGRTTTVDRLRERQYGAIKQQINISAEGGGLLAEKSLDEIREERMRLEKALQAAKRENGNKEE